MLAAIENYLPKGSESPVTAKELQRRTGEDVRTITADDLRDYCGRLKHEEAELRRTRRACERIINKLPKGGAE